MDQSKTTKTSRNPQLNMPEDRSLTAASDSESKINPQDSHLEDVATAFIKCEVTESEGESTTGTQFGDLAPEYVKNEGGTSLCDEVTSCEGFQIDSHSCDTSIAAQFKGKLETGKDDESLTNQIHTTFDIKTESISQSGEERRHDSTNGFRDPCDYPKLGPPVKRETIDDKHVDYNQLQRDPRYLTEPSDNLEAEDASHTPTVGGSQLLSASSFSQESSVEMHMQTHTGDKPFSCSQCTSSSSQKNSLIIHIRNKYAQFAPVCTGEKPYSYNRCTSSFAQKDNLMIHIRTHTGEKPYSCSHCASCFARKSHLIRHMRTHTGEKPFSCSQCTSSFSRKHSLLSHMRSHTGEKLYCCSHCNSFFSQKGRLLRHMRTHTGERPFSCSQCTYSSSQKCNLNKHIRTHSRLKPFSSSHCA